MLEHSSRFELVSDYAPTGDQPQAIDELVQGVNKGTVQTLLGVTGSGKTFSVTNVITRTGKNTLVISHNKNSCSTTLRRTETIFSKK